MEKLTPTASASMLVATASMRSSRCRSSTGSGSPSSSFLDRLARIMLPPIHASSTKAIHGAIFVTCRANWEPSSQPVSGISA